MEKQIENEIIQELEKIGIKYDPLKENVKSISSRLFSVKEREGEKLDTSEVVETIKEQILKRKKTAIQKIKIFRDVENATTQSTLYSFKIWIA